MSLHLFQGKSVILIPCFRVREANSVPCWALHTGMVHDYFMVRISLVRRYHYLNVNDLYCKWTDTSIWGVRNNKDTVTVIWEYPLPCQTSIFLDLLLSLRGRFEKEREEHFEPKFPFSSLSNVKLSHTKLLSKQHN